MGNERKKGLKTRTKRKRRKEKHKNSCKNLLFGETVGVLRNPKSVNEKNINNNKNI